MGGNFLFEPFWPAGTGLAVSFPFALLLFVLGFAVAVFLLWLIISRFQGRAGFSSRVSSELELSRAVLASRRLLLRQLEQDHWGVVSETIRQLLLVRYKGWSFFRRPPFEIGLENAARRNGPDSKGKGAGRRGWALSSFDVTLTGKVEGRSLILHFDPHIPIYQSRGDVAAALAAIHVDGVIEDGEGRPFPVYDCFDFPLTSFSGLTAPLPGMQKRLLAVAVNGVMARGFGLAGVCASSNRLLKEARLFEAALPGLALTQPRLFLEMSVVTAWSFLIAGLIKADADDLAKALSHYEKIDDQLKDQFDGTVFAGIKANEAMAAFALGQLKLKAFRQRCWGSFTLPVAASDEFERLNERLSRAGRAALRTFTKERFPAGHARLVTLLARGIADFTVNSAGFTEGTALPAGAWAGGSTGEVDAIESQLDWVIDFWQENALSADNCEVFLAKGFLARNKARQHVGLQDWERAETGLLAALPRAPEIAPWWRHGRADVLFELGRLYLNWGTDFGNKDLLDKASHYFKRLLTCPLALAHQRAVKAALAYCHLNYGSISNEAPALKRALGHFEKLEKEHRPFEDRKALRRAFCVARARLAILERDLVQARRAVTEISAVLGQNVPDYPPRDVLMRLRARLREMIFLLDGDEVALAWAINDRRALVAMAQDSVSELRWAVEVRDLVALLSRRQYQTQGPLRDFHEAHYLLEKCLAIVEALEEGTVPVMVRGKAASGVSYIKANLYFQLGQLLSTFARVQSDEKAHHEAIAAFEQFLALTPRALDGARRAEGLHHLGQIHMDLSAHYGQHAGLLNSKVLFAEAFDIYLETGNMDQAHRMRRFMENAEAALLAYRPGEEVRHASSIGDGS